jgi:hypothetical protein
VSTLGFPYDAAWFCSCQWAFSGNQEKQRGLSITNKYGFVMLNESNVKELAEMAEEAGALAFRGQLQYLDLRPVNGNSTATSSLTSCTSSETARCC